MDPVLETFEVRKRPVLTPAILCFIWTNYIKGLFRDKGRLVRLVPEDAEDGERLLIKRLLNYRLPPSAEDARLEWNAIVDGTHENWNGIPSEKRELLRSFFILVCNTQHQIVICLCRIYS